MNTCSVSTEGSSEPVQGEREEKEKEMVVVMTMMLMIMMFVSAPTCYLPYRSEGDELLSGGEPINKVPSQHRAGQPAGSVVITQFFFFFCRFWSPQFA
jgi:hypothetical protein